MKKFLALLVAAVLIVSTVGVLTAFAGCSISGDSKVYAGSTYEYKGKASYTGSSLLATVSGLGQTGTLAADNGTKMGDVSLSASASISVKIPSDAAPGKTYTITLSGSYSVDADGSEHSFNETKTITVIAKPASTPRPASTSKPSSSHSGSSGSQSTQAPAMPTPAPTGWALAAIEVPAIAQGAEYDMQMTNDTTVPASVLASLKEKQGVLKVDFGAYSCTIDGAALSALPEGLTGIDLGLTMDKDGALSTAAGGADAYQLHFKHSGALPGRFTYRFKAEQNLPGDVVYLYYYYNESGVVEGKQQCIVDGEGYVTVEIYHCSSYFISNTLIEGAAGILTQPTPEPTATPEPTPAPTVTPEAQPAQNDGLAVSALSPMEQWFGIPYAPLIVALVAAALIGMLLTMVFTRSGLFRRRPKAAAADSLFAPEVPDDAGESDDSPEDDLE